MIPSKTNPMNRWDILFNKMMVRGRTCLNTSFTAESIYPVLFFYVNDSGFYCAEPRTRALKKMLIMVRIHISSMQIC